TDDSIECLAACRGLRKLTIWSTKITYDGLLRLEKALPAAEIECGLYPPAVLTPRIASPRGDSDEEMISDAPSQTTKQTELSEGKTRP
ncbi:MAG: hypothetical protein N2C14_29100, partial [Planctomycetales bacterium]